MECLGGCSLPRFLTSKMLLKYNTQRLTTPLPEPGALIPHRVTAAGSGPVCQLLEACSSAGTAALLPSEGAEGQQQGAKNLR